MNPSETLLRAEDAEALLLGLGMFATGGGGLAARGRAMLTALRDDGIPVAWTPLSALDPDTLACSVFGMGSIAPHPPMTPDEMRRFGVPGERHPRPWLRAVAELEAHLGEPIGAIVPFELGPSNTVVAIDAAARSGRALVDADFVGRALPKMSQALPAVHGLRVWPVAICDPWGTALLMTDAPSGAVAERVGKMVSRVTKAVDVAASCSHAAFPNRLRALAGATVPGTLSRSLAVGRRVLEARLRGDDPVTAARAALGARRLFRGEVRERAWQDAPDGYMEGTTTIAGAEEFRGGTLEIWFQNEHHLARRDGTPVAMSPDIVAVLDVTDATPISNTELAPGRHVVVLGFPGPEAYRHGAALTATEPRHYGIELDYVPIEELADSEPRR